LKESASSSTRLAERERVEALARAAIQEFLTHGALAALALLAARANVPAPAAEPIFALLATMRAQLQTSRELDGLMSALRGEYLEPGPGADLIQNPDILPTGRNTHAVDPYRIPSAVAAQKSAAIVAALLARHLNEQGRYPETIAMVLWGMDNI